ncbi:MAG: M23 family metallopeptidase [Microbacteriaceae bacterium]|nr:M23 family metallopeptidase [Microbacteriaceae bacterium]
MKRRITRVILGSLVALTLSLGSPSGPSFSSAERPAPSSERWLPPIATPLAPVRHFDLPGGPYQAGHRGIDVPATHGQLVRAPSDGVVSFVGMVVDRPLISLRTAPDTVVTLEPVESTLLVGETVRRGATLGTVAEGGHCESRCLHLGVRVNDSYVNPLRFFWAKPVLLPW